MSKEFKNSSGFDIKANYGPQGAEAPGEFPYTRGTRADMYRGRHWTMRQYAGFSTAEESNKRYHYLLNQGTTGLSAAFDLPTQIGYDSDHEFSEGEVGKAGVAIDSIKDMEKNSDIGKDESVSLSSDVQDLTDSYIKKIDETLATKEKEIEQV